MKFIVVTRLMDDKKMRVNFAHVSEYYERKSLVGEEQETFTEIVYQDGKMLHVKESPKLIDAAINFCG